MKILLIFLVLFPLGADQSTSWHEQVASCRKRLELLKTPSRTQLEAESAKLETSLKNNDLEEVNRSMIALRSIVFQGFANQNWLLPCTARLLNWTNELLSIKKITEVQARDAIDTVIFPAKVAEDSQPRLRRRDKDLINLAERLLDGEEVK